MHAPHRAPHQAPHQPRASRARSTTAVLVAAAFLLVAVAFASEPAAAAPGGPPGQVTAPVVHLPPGLVGDPVLVDGATARLQRLESGLATRTDTRELTPGHVVTLWWIVFNNPGACADTPCVLDDLFDDDVEAACLAADGAVVTGAGSAAFSDRLGIGEGRDSCLHKFGATDHGLLDPQGAEVHLMVHDHGPVQPGLVPVMRSTFDGGCDYEAPYGLPTFGITPVAVGQCATIQAAIFLAPTQ